MKSAQEGPFVLSVVALLSDAPDHSLVRGQVGTVLEELDPVTLLVEFADDEGTPYALVPCRRSDLLTLHYTAEAA